MSRRRASTGRAEGRKVKGGGKQYVNKHGFPIVSRLTGPPRRIWINRTRSKGGGCFVPIEQS